MLSDRLKELRKKDGKTQEEFATKLGIARSTYSGYERGAFEPDNETLDKIANYFSVTIDYLLGRTSDPNEKENKKEINHEAVTDLIDFLLDPNSKINGGPIPQSFIDDILGYVNIQLAKDMEKNKSQ